MHDAIVAVARRAALPLFVLLTGCSAHASGRFGDRATYVPAYDAYVVSKEPANPHEDFVFLTDPLTRKKLRCGEEVEAHLSSNASAIEDYVNEDHSLSTSVVAMLPFSMPGATLSFVGTILVEGSKGPGELAGPARPRRLVSDALALFGRGRYSEAIPLLEVALLRDAEVRERSHATYYLGLSYEQLYDEERAVAALQFFVEHGTVRDERAYVTAEERLQRLGHPLPTCRSREAIAIRWPKPSE